MDTEIGGGWKIFCKVGKKRRHFYLLCFTFICLSIEKEIFAMYVSCVDFFLISDLNAIRPHIFKLYNIQ